MARGFAGPVIGVKLAALVHVPVHGRQPVPSGLIND